MNKREAETADSGGLSAGDRGMIPEPLGGSPMPSQPSPPLEEIVLAKLKTYLVRLPLGLLVATGTCALVATAGTFIVRTAYHLVRNMIENW